MMERIEKDRLNDWFARLPDKKLPADFQTLLMERIRQEALLRAERRKERLNLLGMGGRPCCPVFLFGHFMAMAAVADIAPRDVYFLVLRIYRSISFCTLDGRYRFPKILLQKIPAREHMKKLKFKDFLPRTASSSKKSIIFVPLFRIIFSE